MHSSVIYFFSFRCAVTLSSAHMILSFLTIMEKITKRYCIFEFIYFYWSMNVHSTEIKFFAPVHVGFIFLNFTYASYIYTPRMTRQKKKKKVNFSFFHSFFNFFSKTFPLIMHRFLTSAKFIFLFIKHFFTGSFHLFFGISVSRFPTHSPLYFHIAYKLLSILSTLPNILNVLFYSHSHPSSRHTSPLTRLCLILSILLAPDTHARLPILTDPTLDLYFVFHTILSLLCINTDNNLPSCKTLTHLRLSTLVPQKI